LQVGEPDLDQRPNALLQTGFARNRQRLLVALAHLLRSNALLQAVVPGYEQFLDAFTRIAHKKERS
jgi:hypothetical protein